MTSTYKIKLAVWKDVEVSARNTKEAITKALKLNNRGASIVSVKRLEANENEVEDIVG